MTLLSIPPPPRWRTASQTLATAFAASLLWGHLAFAQWPALTPTPAPAADAATPPATVTATAWPDYISSLVAGPSESPVAAALPPDVVITATDPSLPADKARWSGRWQGWACMARACDIRIAVEQLTATGATVVYTGASGQQAQVTDRTPGRFVGDELVLRLHTGARLVLRLRAQGSEMEMSLWRPDTQLLSAGVLSKHTVAAPYTRVVERLPTPWTDSDGRAQTLEAVIYRPVGAAASDRLPTLVFNHGSTGQGNRPDWFRFTWTSPEVAHYFTAKGWQVVFAQRRGRGQSDGVYDEGFAADRSAGYSCRPDRALPGLDRALADLDVVMAQVQQRSDVDPARLLIGGVSRGGILSVAYAGLHPRRFLGVVNFVGGWVGDGCKDAVAINGSGFLRGSPMPSPTLWLYGERDSFYALAHSRASFDAFQAAGGQGRMLSYALPPEQDGHGIHAHPALWQADLDRYLAQILALPRTP